MSSGAGNLSIEAQQRYAFIAGLLNQQLPIGSAVVELGSAPGDQIAQLARIGYIATSVDIGDSTSDAWGDGEQGRRTSLLKNAGVTDIR